MLSPALNGSSANAVASLSRAFAREIENLPTRYLREFYKIKVKDDINALPSPESPGFKARYKRVSRELRKLEAANNGHGAAYQHILSLAYGRKGKLRWELMEPLLNDPSAPLPPPIIPPLESSRPPVYSPEMTVLLGSVLSRPGSTRTAKQLQHPPILPDRANPGSSDAKILGPLSKRREVNLKWRFFEQETARVRLPIEVSRVHAIQTSTPRDNPPEASTIEGSDTDDVEELTPPSVGFQGTSVLHDLEAIASPNPNLPKCSKSLSPQNPTNIISTSTVNHFIRRQHRKLLREIPILTYYKHPGSPIGKYRVSLSPLVYSGSLTGLTSTVAMADEADLAWLRLPPPQQSPRVERACVPLQKPDVKAKTMAGTEQKPDQIPRVNGKLKYESNWVDGGDPPDELQYHSTPKPQVDPKPRVEEQQKAETRSQVSEPPSQPIRPPKKGYRRFDETAGERPQRREFPPRPSSPPLEGIRLFKGSLAEGRPGKPHQKL